eukprot:gb/GFBE01071343.1/.p1 GENE.gb/GFBE01071343.1/~~gb/GFBE01071343.1/.p1  ORF type:complete len:345 (+),score=70.98 gb/GFBE01071343.1/:1-1035(+)
MSRIRQCQMEASQEFECRMRSRLPRKHMRKAAAGALFTAAVAEFACPSARMAWTGALRVPEAKPTGASMSNHAASAEAQSSSRASADSNPQLGRRACGAALAALAALGLGSSSARAVVKGYAPPKGYGLGKNMTKIGPENCDSREECEEAGAKKEEELFGPKQVTATERPFKVTKSGARWKDFKVGNEADGVAKAGSDIKIRYRVMRTGKRSEDGLSGLATTLFSKGYGEDEGPKDATLNAKLGEGQFVKALDEGMLGMAVGGVRRVQVRPDYNLGWKKEGKCADVVQGVGALAGLPFVGVEREGNCLVESLLPQPIDWDAKRRFERRFDETLIVEVELMGVGK